MRRLLPTTLILLTLGGCFTDNPPEPECTVETPIPGGTWCAELDGAKLTLEDEEEVDLLDPASNDHPKACSCLGIAESVALDHPEQDPEAYQAAKDKLRDLAMLQCAALAQSAGFEVWDTNCAANEPTLTYEGPCMAKFCPPDSGGDATAGGGTGPNWPPPQFGITSWNDAVSCATANECTVDQLIAQELLSDPVLLLDDSARFASNESRQGVAGLQLVTAGTDSVVVALGLQLDDVIVSANGMPLESVDDVAAAMLALGSATTIELEVHRGLEVMINSYTLGSP